MILPRATAAFVRREWRFLVFGLLMAFWSSPGQTYVISLFGAQIMTAFGLSHGGWGTLYMYATVASAVLLLFAGRMVDRFRILTMARGGVIALALAALAFPLAAGPVTLFLGFLGLRFTGQGMMSHISATALSRRFTAERGRAVAIGALGFSLGQAVFPPTVVLLLGHFDWRSIWTGFAAVAVLTTLPLLGYLLRRPAHQPADVAKQVSEIPETASDGRFSSFHWRRRDVLRDARFYLLCPMIFFHSALGTALTFHQVHLVAVKGWSLAVWSTGYSFYAVAAVAANLAVGVLIDRFSARALAPFTILPMALSFLAFTGFESVVAAPLILGLSAVSGATLHATLTALWVELYGTRHLGSVRSLAIFVGVVGSAIGPMAFGVAIDRGVGIASLMFVSAALIVVASLSALAALYSALGRRERPS